MTSKLLVTFVFICAAVQLFSQSTIIGKWRRLNPNLKNHDTTDKKPKWGDLEIRADSTFHIEGDTATRNSTIPGWHTGDEYNGTWEMSDNNQLTMWTETGNHTLPITYTILKLTKEELILWSPFDKKRKKYFIRYLRL